MAFQVSSIIASFLAAVFWFFGQHPASLNGRRTLERYPTRDALMAALIGVS